MQIQSSYKVHLNTISNWELSDPICDSVDWISQIGSTCTLYKKNCIISIIKIGFKLHVYSITKIITCTCILIYTTGFFNILIVSNLFYLTCKLYVSDTGKK